MNYYKYIKENIFNKSYQIINEVRLPSGYFRILNQFMLPGADNFDTVFNKNKIIHIDTENKKVLMWNSYNSEWNDCGVTYNQLMDQTLYNKFKANSVKVSLEELPKEIPAKVFTFNTTVRAFNRRADDEGLEPDDKIKVVVT